MIILQILVLILWLLVLPVCMGLLFLPFIKRRRGAGVVLSVMPGFALEQSEAPPSVMEAFAVALVSGYILEFALVELIGIPVVIYVVYNGFSTFMKVLVPVLILLAVLGVCVAFRCKKKEKRQTFYAAGGGFGSSFGKISLEGKLLWILFLALVLFQMYMSFTRASFDGDDAYYGVQALIAQQVDTLYRINPYTGRSAPLDVRHALALFPVWEALAGSISGIHVTIICHSVIPLVFIPLTYLIYYQIGKTLFARKRELLPMFMLLLGLWQMFGNVSLYTTETFFLTRTWQGKSFAGNFVIPAVIWIFLRLYEDEKKAVWWILLGALNLAGGASSSLAVMLSCLMTVGFGFLFAVSKRRISILIKSGLVCVCGGVYVLVYLLLTHGIIG